MTAHRTAILAGVLAGVTATNVMGTKSRCYTFQRNAKNNAWIQGKLVDGGFSYGFTVQEGLPK